LIVVNPSTRQFNVPGADLVFGVESDSGSERKYFQCPRYVGDNLDISGCFVRINYRNANGEIDSYLVDDVSVDGDNIMFSWLLTPKVTKYKGQIKFVMCVVGPDLKVKWHTTQGTGQVLDGLEPEIMVEPETADVVAQLIAMVEAQTVAVEKVGAEQIKAVEAAAETAEAASVAAIEAKGASTLATIPEDYTAIQNAARGAANAIRGKVSGEVIRVDDVSPMEHQPKIRVAGKNLCPVSELTVSGEHPWANKFIDATMILPKGKYTVSADYTQNGTQSFVCVSVRDAVNTTEQIAVKSMNDMTGELTTTFEITESSRAVKIVFYSNLTETIRTTSCTFTNIQLEKGGTATSHTPYIDPTTVTVTRCGKNLLTLPYHEGQTVTRDGITGTVNADGSVHLVGTATANFYFRFKQINLGSTPIFAGNNNGTYSLQNCTYDSANRFVYHQVSKGQTIDKIVYPQVEVGTVKTDYETPHNGETQIPAADGTVSGLTAVSPTMTLLTDKAGVNIECEYSRDTNKVIAEILDKITALGG
jgi:hypothetical protein